MRLLTFVLLTVPLAGQTSAGGPDWRFAHPNATVLGFINAAAVMHSSVMDAIWKQAEARAGSTVKPEQFEKTRAFLDNVDKIYVSMRLDTKGGGDTLFLFTGTFDDDRVMKLLPTAAEDKWHRIDASTLLLGRKEPVALAVRRLAARPGSTPGGAVFQKARALAENDIWIAGSPVAAPGLSGLMRDVRNFSFGVSCQKGFRTDVALDFVSALAANRILARSQTSSYVHVERPTPAAIRISVVVPQSEITPELMQTFAGMLDGGAPAAQDAGAKRKTVTIYGLDDGPKEVPLQKK